WPQGNSFNVSCVGPITRTSSDAALMLFAMAGRDLRDPRSVPTLGEQWHEQIDAGVAGLRVAVLDEPGFPVPPDAEGGRSIAAAAAHLAAAGASVEQAR